MVSLVRNRKLQALTLLGLAALLLLISLNTTRTDYRPPESHSHLSEISDPGPVPDYFFERRVQHIHYDDILLPYTTHTPDTVRMLWCGKKWFEFKHYLSVVSIMKVQQPNKLVIYYWKDNLIMRDRNDYNLWYQELTKEYYNIVTYSLGATAPDCTNEAVMMGHLVDIMKNGGIYINDTIILNKHLHTLRTHNLTVAVRHQTDNVKYSNIAFMVAAKGAATADGISHADRALTCDNSDEWERSVSAPSDDHICLSVMRNYIPAKVMTTNDTMSQKIRDLYYGSPEPRYPEWSMDDPIPNIGHMVLLGGGEMNLLSYLSIRSMIHCVGAERMFVHIDTEPKGVWYEKLKKEEPRAVFTYHEWPGTVFGISIRDGSHSSDLMRFDLLYRYGGIYVDWDAVMLKPLGQLRGYGFVTDFDWPDWHPPYPDVINNGVSAGKKGSRFLRKSLMKFSSYKPEGDWYYNGLMMPYKLYEQYPELVKIERKLQVICYNLKCHPVWLPQYHNEAVHHLNEAKFDWREVYAFHWTRPSPPELLDMDELLKKDSMFAEVGRYVLSCDRDQTLKNLSSSHYHN